MNKSATVLTITILLLISTISASCDKGQIDINSASKEKLQEITQIGPKRAEQIIILRPFDSVEDMIRISGIGETHLANIIAEGLACVNGQEEKDEEKKEEVNEKYQEIEEHQEIEEPLSKETGPVELPGINLNPQVIKSENDNENLSKSNYAVYGLVFFCVLLVALFILRKNKHNKNEFR
ncbi:hypothetical protein ES703_04086 [subsurface metagenome]